LEEVAEILLEEPLLRRLQPGYGDTAALDPRNPRIEFDEACTLL